jgi:hypothetical protein
MLREIEVLLAGELLLKTMGQKFSLHLLTARDQQSSLVLHVCRLA